MNTKNGPPGAEARGPSQASTRAARTKSILAAWLICVTCGRREAPSRSGNCRLTQDRPPIFLPQTPAAETAQRIIVELDAAHREAEAQEAAQFAAMAARIRSAANTPSYAELSERRGQPDRAASARALHERIWGAG